MKALEKSISAAKIARAEDLVQLADKKREARALGNNADKIRKTLGKMLFSARDAGFKDEADGI